MGSGQVAISNSKQCEKANKNLVTNMWMRVKFLFLFRERVDVRMSFHYNQTNRNVNAYPKFMCIDAFIKFNKLS